MLQQARIPIPTPYPKVTMYFASSARRWSEHHYYNNPAGLAAIPAAFSAGVQLAGLRNQMLGVDCSLYNVEVTLPGAPRITQATDYWQTTAGCPDPTNVTNDCVRVLLRGTADYRRSCFCGGIPDPVLNNDVYLPDLEPGFFNAIQDYLNALTSGDVWGYLAIAAGGAAGNRTPIRNIANAAAPNLKTFTITTNAAHGITVNPTVIRLSGVGNANVQMPWNQLWLANPATATTLVIQVPQYLGVTQILNTTGGFVRPMAKMFKPYKQVGIIAIGTRKRGVREKTPLGRKKLRRNVGF
jgi:hypothetical protein